MAQGFDWPGLLRAGLQGLGLQPQVFWQLTPIELRLMLGVEAGPPALTRARLEELQQAFPDLQQGKGDAAGCDGTDRSP